MIGPVRQKRMKRRESLGRRHIMRRRWTIRTLCRKHEGRCALCGRHVDLSDEQSPRYATIDHVVPRSKGGQDVPSNIQLACRACNSAKGDADPVAFEEAAS